MTQAIHIPTLARLADLFTVVNVMDVVPTVAETVAARVGARASTRLDEVLDDPSVDVVAICSPPQFHADQVEAAIRAGKRAILCEKPFTVSRVEAERLALLSQEANVPIVVGAMHVFDPGWLAAAQEWDEPSTAVRFVRSSIVLPLNARYENWATQIHPRSRGGEQSSTHDMRSQAAALRDGVLTLAIHNLPLVRRFAPEIERVVFAKSLLPYGYAITLDAGNRIVELLGLMHKQWRPEWTLDVWAEATSLHVAFPPSYVQAGSATATVSRPDRSRVFGPYATNGYLGEWRHLWELVDGGGQPPEEIATIVDDLSYAIGIADNCVESVLAGG